MAASTSIAVSSTLMGQIESQENAFEAFVSQGGISVSQWKTIENQCVLIRERITTIYDARDPNRESLLNRVQKILDQGRSESLDSSQLKDKISNLLKHHDLLLKKKDEMHKGATSAAENIVERKRFAELQLANIQGFLREAESILNRYPPASEVVLQQAQNRITQLGTARDALNVQIGHFQHYLELVTPRLLRESREIEEGLENITRKISYLSLCDLD